ncbi:hypothetical protein [Pseudoalteromonas rubra]|uniref:hypothetical protein n=1 Tax=Pseudoalteromonas rubra TaxID=43658 RepID=UPI000F7B6B41|nr:hypothetical protein [Pseudoalteromonas rubra]
MNNPYGERFKKLVELDETSIRILDGIRYRDEDLSVKSGAILAFSGLMIATSIVQLSTSEGSLVYIPKDFTFLTITNSLGLIFLFVSSLISLFGLISSGKNRLNRHPPETGVRNVRQVQLGSAPTLSL